MAVLIVLCCYLHAVSVLLLLRHAATATDGPRPFLADHAHMPRPLLLLLLQGFDGSEGGAGRDGWVKVGSGALHRPLALPHRDPWQGVNSIHLFNTNSLCIVRTSSIDKTLKGTGHKDTS